MDAVVRLTQEIGKLWNAVRKLQVTGFQRPTWRTAALTSTAWDGDVYSTTAKTLIDLSAVFGVPANVKAIIARIYIRDSAASGGNYWLMLSPNNVAFDGFGMSCVHVDDEWTDGQRIVPCNSDGDVYYQIVASGAGTMDVYLQIWGYFL